MTRCSNGGVAAQAAGLPGSGEILGVRVDPVDMRRALATLGGWIERGERHYVCLATAHTIMDARRDPKTLAAMNKASLVTADGMAVVWILRGMGFKGVDRVYGPDLMLGACGPPGGRGWRHYFYGGGEGVATRLVTRLRGRSPDLRVAGVACPPFRPLTESEDARAVEHINDSGADIVWVGLGSPKQERWMAEHRSRLRAPILIGVGAAFDFLSGERQQAPRWMQRGGLEWMFRLMTDPRKTARRCVWYPLFVFLLVLRALRMRQRERGRDPEVRALR
jgi:N-acetylglucosaminyldiphosphoundecaprenol N-acetyl-beta-D-mannosaminyltransferase